MFLGTFGFVFIHYPFDIVFLAEALCHALLVFAPFVLDFARCLGAFRRSFCHVPSTLHHAQVTFLRSVGSHFGFLKRGSIGFMNMFVSGFFLLSVC